MLHSTESHRVWSALRWRRVGANWQQVQTCFRHTVYIHVHVGATYTPEWATHHSATCHNHHLRPDFSTSGAHVMCCHQPQRGTRSLFFKNSDLVFTLSLLHQLFRDCLHTSLSLRIHHAWIHSCSHRCSSTWVCNMHSRTELTWERLNIACSLS